MAGRVPMPNRGAMPSSQSNMNRRAFTECLPPTRTSQSVSAASQGATSVRQPGWPCPGLSTPRRRTFAMGILPFAHSMLTALARSPPLRHPVCAGQQRRLSGHGQPLADAGRQAVRSGLGPEGRVSTSGRRPWRGGMAGCHAQHQKPEVSKRLTLDGHSPVTGPRCRVSREASSGPAARERPGPAACRWYWRRATSCHWRSAAEVRRASAAWTAEAGWSLPACSAETGCSTVGPDC